MTFYRFGGPTMMTRNIQSNLIFRNRAGLTGALRSLGIPVAAAVFASLIFSQACAQSLSGVDGAQSSQAGTTANCGAGQGGPGLNGSYPTSSIKTIADARAAAGRSYGDGQCVALTKAMSPGTPSASTWTRGALVQGNGDIPVGTPIATFNYASSEGSTGYGPSNHPGGWYGVSHTGIYLGQDSNGIWILDQFKGSAARVHQITWANGAGGCNMNSSMECANRYYVISNAGGASEGGGGADVESGKNDPLASLNGNAGLDGQGTDPTTSASGTESCQVPDPSQPGSGKTVNLSTGSGGPVSQPSGLGGLGGGASGSSGGNGAGSSGGGSGWTNNYKSGGSFELPRLEGRNF